MSLFGNYNTPGRGVLKAPQEKKGIFKFFEVYGRHMWKLMELNLLYFVFCIPLTLMVILMLMTSNPIWLLLAIPSVLIGPATAAMTKVCRNYSQERNAFLLHDFWDSFKKNFKQGTIMGAIDIIFAIGFMVGIPMYKYWAEQNSMIYIPFVICISCLIVFFMMHFYIYLMISSTNLNMKQIIKNSFYLVSLGIKQSLWSLLASLIVIVMMYLFLPYSVFRCSCFEDKYGMLLVDGPLKGLLARGVIVVDGAGKVVYEELVPEITTEPNYDAALAALK